MAPKICISIQVVAWARCILIHGTTMVILAGFVAASQSSSLEPEAKSLVESGWWNGYSNYTSLSHCEWYGITCNAEGSVTEIDMVGSYLEDKFRKFNFSSFPNLVRLNLSYS